jgi:hypothetical protein
MDALRRTPVAIPGYYFDEKQDRYFKVEKDSNVHNNHPHSTSVLQHVKRQRISHAARLSKADLIKSTQLIQPTKRDRLLNSSLSGTRLLMESGSVPRRAQYQKLTQGYLDLFPSNPPSLQQPENINRPRCMARLTQNYVQSGISISSFGWDDAKKALFYAIHLPDRVDPLNDYSAHLCINFYNQSTSPFFPAQYSDPSLGYGVINEPEPHRRERLTTELGLSDAKVFVKPGECVSVMGYRGRTHKHNQMIVKTWGSLYHPDLDLLDPDESFLSDNYWRREKKISGDYATLAWTPTSDISVPHFAMGTVNSVYEFDATIQNFPEGAKPDNYRLGWTNSTVKSMEYVIPNVIAAGLQNANVMMFDRRAPCTSGVMRLKHSDPINHITKADNTGNTLIVVGLGKMSLYDLRMTKAIPRGSSSSYSNGIKMPAATKPLFNFTYHNQLHNHMGFSISRTHKVAAAAQGDGSFSIYSTQSGTVLKNFKMASYQQRPENGVRMSMLDARYSGVGPGISQLQIIDDPSSAFRVLALHNGAIWNYGPEDSVDTNPKPIVTPWVTHGGVPPCTNNIDGECASDCEC